MTEGSEGDIFDQAITRREAQMLFPMSLFPFFSLFLFIFLFFYSYPRKEGGMLITGGRGKGRNDTVAPTKR